MKKKSHPLVLSLITEMERAANPAKAKPMQAYMKTGQPFYGIPSVPRRAIFKEAIKKHPITSREEYERVILELWNGEHRETMYQALEVAERCKKYLEAESWPFYERLMRSATNWDTLDWIVGKLISPLVLKHRKFEHDLKKWRKDENFWVRRAALLAHLHHKEKTNSKLLAETILPLAHEKEFFVRKAIGWVLRDYSYSNPQWVLKFVTTHQERLSGLSKREALKQIEREKKR